MPSLNQILKTIAFAALVAVVGGLVGLLAQLHLEISFDGLKAFQSTKLDSYAALIDAIHLEFDLTKERRFTAFWIDHEAGTAKVERSDVSYKVFRLNNRIAGRIHDISSDATYAITGYYNTGRIVFSQLGDAGATGVYILDTVPFNDIPSPSYAGYAIFDEETPGTSKGSTAECPFVMIPAKVAAKQVSTNVDPRKIFPILNTACTEFKLP